MKVLRSAANLWRYSPNEVVSPTHVSLSTGLYLGATTIYGAVQFFFTEAPKRLRAIKHQHLMPAFKAGFSFSCREIRLSRSRFLAYSEAVSAHRLMDRTRDCGSRNRGSIPRERTTQGAVQETLILDPLARLKNPMSQGLAKILKPYSLSETLFNFLKNSCFVLIWRKNLPQGVWEVAFHAVPYFYIL